MVGRISEKIRDKFPFVGEVTIRGMAALWAVAPLVYPSAGRVLTVLLLFACIAHFRLSPFYHK